jgi:antitoxin (DNA-binding transcriptional repressor) of toxin-antitoxin stability system
MMKAVGIRELKARLSAYLRDVQAGQVVLVTDRGRVIAELRAPGPAGAAESVVNPTLALLARSGVLRLGEAHPPHPYPASAVRAAGGTALDLLAEERGER